MAFPNCIIPWVFFFRIFMILITTSCGVDNKKERKNVVQHLRYSGKAIIAISEAQLQHFAGNMLQVWNDKNEKLLVMSQDAHQSISPDQVSTIEKYGKIISSDLSTTETCG